MFAMVLCFVGFGLLFLAEGGDAAPDLRICHLASGQALLTNQECPSGTVLGVVHTPLPERPAPPPPVVVIAPQPLLWTHWPTLWPWHTYGGYPWRR